MPRFRSRLARKGRVLLAALLLSITIWDASAAERQLLLDVVINEQPTGSVAQFVDHDGDLSATSSELQSIGLATSATDDKAEVTLSSLGIKYRLDDAAQRLFITAPDKALIAKELGASRSVTEAVPVTPSPFGVAMNYDVSATVQGGRSVGAGLLDSRIFGQWGVASNSLLATSGTVPGQNPVIRLDTTVTHDDPDSLRRYQAGDVITSGLLWTRPVRLGGLQLASNFAMRPDLVTFPVPTVSGSAAVPSTVDVFVNGVQQFSGKVDQGPFAVRQLPVVTGSGDVSVVVRDALGRETVTNLPFYASSSLLAPGLASYGVETGFVRRNYGLSSNDYRDPVGTGTLRYGLTQRLTLETHAEVAQSLGMAGGGGSFSLGQWGVVSAAVAASSTRGKMGMQASASYQRVTKHFSVGASITQASSRYGDVAALAGDPAPRRIVQASLGVPLSSFGNISLAYAGVTRSSRFRQPAQFYYGAISTQSSASIISASYTKSLNSRASFYATAFRDLKGGSTGVGFGVSIALSDRTFAGGSVDSNKGSTFGTVYAARAAVQPGDVGGRVSLSQGSQTRQLLEGEYRSQSAQMTAGVDRFNGQTAARAGAQGSLAWLDGTLFLAPRIQDSFAVVDTGQPGTTVLYENRPVGRTNGSGKLLLPDLRAYEENRIGVDVADIPVDTAFGATNQMVRPVAGSGVLVRFPFKRSSSARIRLVDTAGHPLPVGSTAQMTGYPSPLPIGHDGETFASELQTENSLTATLPSGGHCAAHFAFKPAPNTVPLIGPVVCR